MKCERMQSLPRYAVEGVNPDRAAAESSGGNEGAFLDLICSLMEGQPEEPISTGKQEQGKEKFSEGSALELAAMLLQTPQSVNTIAVDAADFDTSAEGACEIAPLSLETAPGGKAELIRPETAREQPLAETVSSFETLILQSGSQKGTIDQADPLPAQAPKPETFFAGLDEKNSAAPLSEAVFHWEEDNDRPLKKQTEPVSGTGEEIAAAAQPAETPRAPEGVSAKIVEKANELAQRGRIFDQLGAAIRENSASGKQEFTFKLKPEHLGGITVKLTEQDGKMILRIAADVEKTARIINGDLAALREAVRPMQVEVQPATARMTETPGGQTQQFGFGSQQFSGQQHHFAERSPRGFYQAAEAGETFLAQPPAPTLSRGGLDTYI